MNRFRVQIGPILPPNSYRMKKDHGRRKYSTIQRDYNRVLGSLFMYHARRLVYVRLLLGFFVHDVFIGGEFKILISWCKYDGLLERLTLTNVALFKFLITS